MDLPLRPRRNRSSAGIRGLVREIRLHPEQLIQPLFVHRDEQDQPLESLPGQTRWSLTGLSTIARRCHEAGLGAVVLFPRIEDELKDERGSAADDPGGLVPRAIAAIKETAPELLVITDVALDPYSSAGHDGLVEREASGRLRVLNDETVERLCAQALCHAEAGADLVAPSDMMDGRVAAIRETLDTNGHQNVGILAYTAKYASAFYGPFRGALDSAPKEGDKKGYQMDPANAREALREAALDEAEGADLLMVKPAGPCLDILARLRAVTTLPLAAYQVSGEYLMIETAAASGWIERRAVVLESLTGIHRAGADCILTYHALETAGWLTGNQA